jgi:hypothetical protein
MACGHLFCAECYSALLKQPGYKSHVNGRVRLKCALCRELVPKDESYHVSTRKAQDNTRNDDLTRSHSIKENNYDYELATNELSHIYIQVFCWLFLYGIFTSIDSMN